MEEGSKKKKFLPVKKDRLKAFKERKASMDSINEGAFSSSMDDGDTMTLDGIVKKKINLPKKFKKDDLKTGTLDTKKFSIFGEVQADKKKKTKNKNDDDDDLGADLKHWLKGKQLKKTEDTALPPQPKSSSELEVLSLRRVEKEMEAVSPQPPPVPPEEDPLDVELTDDEDEYRDDNNDLAERELAAVFQNDIGKEDDGITELKSATPTNRSASDILKRKNKFIGSPDEKKKPPSRGSYTPGTLRAEKLLKFGDYNLTERSSSKASEIDEQSDVESVSPFPAVEESQHEAPPSTPPPVVPKDKVSRDGDSRLGSQTPSEGERSDSRGPGKLQFKMQEKKQVKKDVKTGQLNMLKYMKFGEGNIKKRDEDTPESESPLPDPPKRRVMNINSFDKGRSPFVDDTQKPKTSTLPSQPSSQFSMKRQRKVTRDESIDPFENLPETVTEQTIGQNKTAHKELSIDVREPGISHDKQKLDAAHVEKDGKKSESPLLDPPKRRVMNINSFDKERSPFVDDTQKPKTSTLPSQPSSQLTMKWQRKVTRDESIDPFENLPETVTEQTIGKNKTAHKELSIDVREPGISHDKQKLDAAHVEKDGKKLEDAIHNYDPSGYNVHRIAKLPSPDVIKKRKKMTIHDSKDDFLSDMLNNLKDTGAEKKMVSKDVVDAKEKNPAGLVDEQVVSDTIAQENDEDTHASKVGRSSSRDRDTEAEKTDGRNESLLKLTTSSDEVYPVSSRHSNLLQEIDSDIKRLAGRSDDDKNGPKQSSPEDDKSKRSPHTYDDTDFDLSNRATTDRTYKRESTNNSLDGGEYKPRTKKSDSFETRDYDSSVGRRSQKDSDDEYKKKERDLLVSDLFENDVRTKKPCGFKLKDYDSDDFKRRPKLEDDIEFASRKNEGSSDDEDERKRIKTQYDFEIRENGDTKSNLEDLSYKRRKANEPIEHQEIEKRKDGSGDLENDRRRKKQYDFSVRDYETGDILKRKPSLEDFDYKRKTSSETVEGKENEKIKDGLDDFQNDERRKKQYEFSVRDYETGDILKRKPSLEDFNYKRKTNGEAVEGKENEKIKDGLDDFQNDERRKKQYDFSVRDYETGDILKRKPSLEDFNYKRKTNGEAVEGKENEKRKDGLDDLQNDGRRKKKYDFSVRDYETGDIQSRKLNSEELYCKRKTSSETVEDPEAEKRKHESEDLQNEGRKKKDCDFSLRDYDNSNKRRRRKVNDDDGYKRKQTESKDDDNSKLRDTRRDGSLECNITNRTKKEYDFAVRDYDSGNAHRRAPLGDDFDFKRRNKEGDEDKEDSKDRKDYHESEGARRRRLQAQYEEEEKRERRRLLKEFEELKRKEKEDLERAELEEMRKEEEEQKKRKRSVEFNESKNDYYEPSTVSKRKAIDQEVKEQEQKILERKARLEEAERQRKLDEEEMKKNKVKKKSTEQQYNEELQKARDRKKSHELFELQQYEEKLKNELESRRAEQLAMEEEKQKERERRKREREEEREREQLAWQEEKRRRMEEDDKKWEQLKMRREKRASRDKIDQEQLLNLHRIYEEKEMKRLEEMQLERERVEAERLEQLEHQKEMERRIWEKLMERERELKKAEEEVRVKRERLREEAEIKLQQFRKDEIRRKREQEERRQLNKLEKKVKKKAQIEHENEEMDRLMELERRRAEEKRRKQFEEEERLRNLEIEQLREEEERRRREWEAIAEEMRKIEMLRKQRAEQRRKDEEERRRREEEERIRFLEEQRRKAEELERRRREMEEAERLLLLELEEKRRREDERLRLLEEQRRREEEERLRREEEERRRRLESEEEKRQREEEERRRLLEEEERRRREAEERALRMMEKNNFDGWSLLAVGEEAIIEESKNKDGGEDTMKDNANEINLVEVEEEQVKRSKEKWILVARGKEEMKDDFEDEWISLAQGSEVAENKLNNLNKWKAWARESHHMSETDANAENDKEFWSSDKRFAWDKRCLPIQVDEFISVQEKYQFTFVDRKGCMKVLKTHTYNVDDRMNHSENGLAKRHSMFFVENTTRDLQDYQLRMRGLLMKLY